MARRAKLVIVALAIVAAFALAAVLTARVEWRQCKICGMQEYERSVFGIVIEALSERNYDEHGTAREWREEHGRECQHEWQPRTRKSDAARHDDAE